MKRFVVASTALAALCLEAATVVWDSDPATPGAQDGAGAWDGANTNWWDGAANTNWTDATPDAAVIGVDQAAAGTITLSDPRAVQGLTFSRALSGGYVLTNGALSIGAGGINLAPYVATNKLLDTVGTQPAGAWSLRKLRTSYAGPVVNVRRPSDGVTTDLYFDATGFVDTNALAVFVGTETGTVARWYDQSGNGRDGVQNTATNQPQLHNPNGKWAILGRGNQLLIATNCTVGQMVGGGSNGAAALVYRAQTVSQATFGWFQSNSSDMRWSAHLTWGDGNLYFDPGSVGGARVQMANGLNNGVWQQYTLVRTNANSTIRWGGMERLTATGRSGACTTSATQWGVLGAVNTPGPAYGDLVEYLQFASGLSTSDLQIVESSQAAAFNVGALDVVDVAAAGAWSLRKLRTAYTGPVVNVRRPSDSATTDLYFNVAGFLDTNALAVFVGTETGTVARWYDQSGNGRDGVQGTAANQPQLHNPNGKWAVLGRGNQWLHVTNCTILQMTMGGSNGTVAQVWRAQNIGGQGNFGWYDAGTRWSAHVNHSDGTLYFDPGNAAGARVQAGNGGNAGVWQQYSLIRSNGYGAIRWAGVDRATSTTRAGAITSTGTQWGVLGAVGMGTQPQGDITEYIQFANGLGPTNLLALEANQAAVFGTLTVGTLGPTYYATVASPVTLQVSQAWSASNGAVLAVSGDVDGNGQNLRVDGIGFVNISGAISGTGALSKIGTGALVLSGAVANTYSGLTTLTNGVMGLAKSPGVAAVAGDFTADNVLSPDLFTKANNQFSPASVLRITGTSGDHVRFELLGTTQTLAGVDNANSGRGVVQQREVVPDANVGAASRLVLGGAGAYTFNGYFRDTGGLLTFTKNGSGTQTLAGANITFTGPTAVEAGRLILSNANAFSSAISNAAVVEFADTAVGNINKGLTGPGQWFKTGTGTQHLTGASANQIAPSGQFFIQQGVLQNNNNAVNWSNNLAGIDISAGAVLDLYADPILVPTLTGQGIVRSFYGNNVNQSGIATNTERLTVGLTNASSAFAGTLTDTGTNGTGVLKGFLELLKVGTGTLTLSGTNTHGGPTLVGGGTLALAASGSLRHSALIAVSNGATFDVTAAGSIQLGTNQALGGAGTVLGGVIARSGSRLVPGVDAVATLSITGSVGLHAAATNVFHLGAVTNEGGAFNDLVAVTGDLEPSNSVIRIDPVAPLASGTYRLFTYTGSKATSFNPGFVNSGLGRKGAYLDEATGGQINLVVTGAYGALVWLPQTSAVWNTIQNNWSNTVAAALDLYGNLDEVLFNEAGAYSNVVSIPTAVTPSRVTVAGASNYTFTGAAIAGVASLVKTGASTLVVLNTNTFSGPTTIEEGTIQLGDGGVINNLGGTSFINVTNTGTLSMFANGDRTVAQAIRGNGTWLMRGPGVSNQGGFDPTNDNSGFSGTIISTNCRFTVTSPLDVGAASSIIAQERGQFWLLAGTNDRPLFITGLGWQEGAGQLGAIRLSNATNTGPVTLTGYARISTHNTGERGTISGNISGPHTLELWNGSGGFTFFHGTNTFANLNLIGGWHFFGHSLALGSGTINFNNGGLSAYPAPLIVTNPVQPGAIAMHVGSFEGYLPITFANTITITNTHVDAYIYNTSTVVGAFTGGATKGIYKYASGELRLAGTNTLGWLYNYTGGGIISLVSNSITTVAGSLQANANGLVRVSDNAQATFGGGVLLGESSGGGGGHVVQEGGVLTTTASGFNFRIGHYPNELSTYTMNGGVLNASNAVISVGWDGTGRLIITNGTVNALGLQLDGNGNSSLPDLLQLSGSGVLSLGGSGLAGAVAGGLQTVLLGGGRITAVANWTAANNQNITLTNTSGATTWDTAGFNITADCVLNGVGGLNKAGAGALALNQLNTYTDATTVSGGVLVVNGQIGPGPVTVGASGTLAGTGTVLAAVSVAGAVQPGSGAIDGRLSATSVNFAAGSACNPLSAGTGSLLRVTATNSLFLPSGTSTSVVNVQNATLPAGTYTVINYEGEIQGGNVTNNLVLGIPPPRSVMYLTNNDANTSVDLVIVTAGESIRWIGNVNGNWNIDAPTNWMTTIGGVPTAFLQPGAVGDVVLLDDLATGNFAITLLTNVSPALVVASNAANDYAIGGGFGIDSPAPLRKYDAAKLTLTTSNNFAGGAAIYGGTLQLGDGTNAGTIGTGPVTNDGVLVISHAQTNVLANPLTGVGSLAKAGPGRVTLSVVPATNISGTVVDGGTFALVNANASKGTLTINDGGTVDATVTDAIDFYSVITVNRGGRLLHSGGSYNQFYNAGAGGTILVMNGGLLEATVAPHANYGNYLLRGNMLVGGTNVSVVAADFRMGDNATRTITVGETGEDIDLWFQGYVTHFHGASCGGFDKAGPGTMALSCPSNNVCSATISAGRLLLLDANLGVSPVNNGTLEFYTSAGSNQTFTAAISGSGTTVKSGAGALSLTGAISAAQNVVVNGGTLVYPNAQTYPGVTTVSNGLLRVQGSVVGPVTVETNGTLGGTGVVRGAVLQNGAISPGPGLGTLTVSNTLTSTGTATTRFELGGTNAPTDYDQLIVSDVHTPAGLLEVVTTNGYVPASGDAFLIISNSALGGALFGTFNTESLPTLAIGLGWVVQYNGTESVGLLVTGTVASATAYELWAQSITNPALRGEQEDPDGDGYANLFEYSQGSDATNAADNAKLHLARTNGQFLAAFNRVNTATDIVYEVEGAYAPTNGATWLGIATNAIGSWGSSTNVNDNNTATIHRVWVTDLELGTNRTLRLKVTRP